MIADDLSPFYQGMFFSLRDIVGKKSVWTSGNQLFVRTTEGVKKVTAETYDNIIAHVRDHPLPETASSREQTQVDRPERGDGDAAGNGGGTRTPPGSRGAWRGRGGVRGFGRGRTPPRE